MSVSLLYDHPDFVQSMRFRVYIGLFKMGFSKITGIETSVETEVMQQGGVNDYSYSLAAPQRTEKTMIFERGVAFSRGLLTPELTPGMRLADISIALCDNRGVPIKMIFVTGGYVKKVSYGELDAMSGEILLERFEISYEMMKITTLPSAVL